MQNRGGPSPDETRNMFIAIGLSLAIFLGFEFFYSAPMRARMQAEEQARIEAQAGAQSQQSAAAPGAAAPETAEGAAPTTGRRVPIDTAAVDGSISLVGARIDDLNLRTYRRAIEAESEEVALLAPMGSEFGHDAFFGWERRSGDDANTLAGADSTWSALDGAMLTAGQPVTLTFSQDGLVIERTISIDDDYMFTITDTVRNETDAAVALRPFGAVRRQGLPRDYRNNPIVHQGLIGAFGPNNNLHQANFNRANDHARDKARGRAGESERLEEEQGQGGWFGITEHYWLTAIVPDQNERVSAYFDSRPEANQNDYRAAYRGEWREAAPGQSVTYTQRLFAGAKRVELLQAYQNSETSQPIPRFDDAIDWGNFWFLTRPFFLWLLHPLAQLVGNFGIAILLTTIVVKAILFPLVYHSFKAMAKMRTLQPKMKEVQERYAADKQRQQQELMKLYQTEKINPVSGCLPMLLQIPVFFALYKTLSVTIEMRHAPFFGWIQDLSARDPTSLFNLFGLLPYDVPGILVIGAWPIMYGLTMWLLQKLSPPMGDPLQAKIFQFLPFVFTIMFAAFAAGLVIYWTWSNVLSMLQQYVIMRRQGVETQMDTWLKKRFGRPAAAE